MSQLASPLTILALLFAFAIGLMYYTKSYQPVKVYKIKYGTDSCYCSGFSANRGVYEEYVYPIGGYAGMKDCPHKIKLSGIQIKEL